jgi:hypothetical protein
MGNVSGSELAAVAIYTRIGVLAAQLGIDGFQLESSRKQLTPAVNEYARVWIDAEFRRIALRTLVSRPPMLTRPGTTYLELETNPDGDAPNGTLLVVGRRALSDDLQLLAHGTPSADVLHLDEIQRAAGAGTPGLPATVVTQLETQLLGIGASSVDVVGQRMVGTQLEWLLGIELPAPSVREATTLAEAIGIEPYQLAMLGALHGDLAASECLLTISCSRRGVGPQVTIEYRDLAWEQVVTTAARLRAKSSASGFGVFAGAFAAERAACFEVTLGRDELPRVRAAIEHTTAG